MCLGIAGASIHLCGSCRGMDQASQMRLTYSMARAATALDMLTVMLGSLILVGTTTQGLEAVHLYVLFFVVFTVLHTYLSSRIAYAASRMRQLLNPVSSGLVPLA